MDFVKSELDRLGGKPGTVYLPAGKYTSDEILLSPGQTILGDRWATTILFNGSGIKLSDGCAIRDICLTGPGAYGITTHNIVGTGRWDQQWVIENVIVDGFVDGFNMGNSGVGVLRDVRAINCKHGFRIWDGYQTTTKIEGNSSFFGNQWGGKVEGMANMTLKISALFEANREGGLWVSGECQCLSVQGCHFENNGRAVIRNAWVNPPADIITDGPDLKVEGIHRALGILDNGFFGSDLNLSLSTARFGEIARNYFDGRVPIKGRDKNHALSIHDNYYSKGQPIFGD